MVICTLSQRAMLCLFRAYFIVLPLWCVQGGVGVPFIADMRKDSLQVFVCVYVDLGFRVIIVVCF